MAINWPASLPQNPATFGEQPNKIIASSQNDAGPNKTRPRFTKAARKVRMTFLLSIEQYLTLDAFFENDLKGGAVAMNFRHPWTGDVKQMYINEPPSASDSGPLAVQVSLNAEYF